MHFRLQLAFWSKHHMKRLIYKWVSLVQSLFQTCPLWYLLYRSDNSLADILNLFSIFLKQFTILLSVQVFFKILNRSFKTAQTNCLSNTGFEAVDELNKTWNWLNYLLVSLWIAVKIKMDLLVCGVRHVYLTNVHCLLQRNSLSLLKMSDVC